MSHSLAAIISGTHVAEEVTRLFPVALWVSRPHGLALLPITADLIHAAGGGPGLQGLPARLSAVLLQLSTQGPVVVVETEYFGGIGEQSATAFLDGMVVLPRVTADTSASSPPRPAEAPINRALALFGITDHGSSADLFDALGLGECRSTDVWAERARTADRGRDRNDRPLNAEEPPEGGS